MMINESQAVNFPGMLAQPEQNLEPLSETVEESGRNFFKGISSEDPTLGIHTTIVTSGESVHLPPLEAMTSPDAIYWPDQHTRPQRLGGIVVEVVAVLAQPYSAPSSENVMNLKTLQADLEQGSVRQSAPLFATHGTRRPLEADHGLRQNPVVGTKMATLDGTPKTPALSLAEALALHDKRINEAVVLGTVATFSAVQAPSEKTGDSTTSRYAGTLSMMRPAENDTDLVGLIIDRETAQLRAITLDVPTVEAIAMDDADLNFVGWVGREGDTVSVYGRDSLMGDPDAAFPCLMIKTSVELEQPRQANPVLVRQVLSTLANPSGGEQLKPTRSESSENGQDPSPPSRIAERLQGMGGENWGMPTTSIRGIISGDTPRRWFGKQR